MAAPASQPPTSPASMVNLPDDLLLSILSRIPCKADRARMSVVCKAWRTVLARLKAPRPRPLPWLLLPTPPHLGGSTSVACALSGFRVHHFISINPAGPRFFGSHDGAWLFLYYSKKRKHLLLGLDARNRNPRVRDLPAEILRWTGDVHRMVILAATLSSSPDDPNCVAAAIVAASRDPDPAPGAVAPLPQIQRCPAFWRMGQPRAMEGALQADQPVLNPEDLLYHDGAFRFLLTHGDNILVCTPTISQAGKLITDWELQSFHPDGRIDEEQFIRARYLVGSRGELLLVLRFAAGTTQLFKVFMATRHKISDSDAGWSWNELDTLGGRMLFVGYGCSRSYEVDQYPGLKDGVYFLDDGKLVDDAMILGEDNKRQYPCVDDAVIFGEDNKRQYPCSDNGRWSEGHVQCCFPRPEPSDHSPPVWLLP